MSSIARILACAQTQGAKRQRRRSQPAFIMIMIMKLVSVCGGASGLWMLGLNPRPLTPEMPLHWQSGTPGYYLE